MIIYGKQLFLHVLNNYPNRLKTVYLAKKCEQKLFSTIANATSTIVRVDNQKAQSLSRGGNHQGFIAEIEDLEYSDFSVVKNGSFLVILNEITDVGNIGAIVRSAYAFGADGVIISGIKSVNLEAIIRSSSAAVFELPIILYPSALDMANELKQVGFTLYGADMNGMNVNEVKFDSKVALVMGSEGEGINKKVKAKLDKIISIKMARAFDSLNVSAATAVICDRITNG
ncbi:23S rRNA (guanosine(2251)-2'-O)-methyltransferase RlmB [Sulfurospirillum arcachonense]|uniref:23S rRNA (guanosine(2251)-2'-O)-methyltransferase RlmB n=1 Tax=Sulfurospirillum arcachonense TaxID=57666 RepID=UPI000469FBA2|nr:23S rRNA (guanosine(2251)-2'-O)-methyltransferase RlmB [Sulfurospirillum arcachonense]